MVYKHLKRESRESRTLGVTRGSHTWESRDILKGNHVHWESRVGVTHGSHGRRESREMLGALESREILKGRREESAGETLLKQALKI